MKKCLLIKIILFFSFIFFSSCVVMETAAAFAGPQEEYEEKEYKIKNKDTGKEETYVVKEKKDK